MRPDPDDKPVLSARSEPVSAARSEPVHPAQSEPVLPQRSEDESSIGWGEAPEPDDDERLRRERPPHWDQ
jgi:hypothetical protein